MTDLKPYSPRLSVAEPQSLPDDVRARIDEVREKAGFVPNVYRALAQRPAEFRAFFAYYDALMLKQGGLTKAEREMIVVATSAGNSCLYCVVSHGALLRIYSKEPHLAEQIAVNWREAPLTARQRAMLGFATKIAGDPGAIGDADMAALRGHGFDDEAIWDIGAIAALFALSNRMATLLAIPPNDEFYSMGRELKD